MFAQPFVQAQIKENIKAPCRWTLCREFTGDWGIPAQRASNAENVSISRRHHVFVGMNLKMLFAKWWSFCFGIDALNMHCVSQSPHWWDNLTREWNSTPKIMRSVRFCIDSFTIFVHTLGVTRFVYNLDRAVECQCKFYLSLYMLGYVCYHIDIVSMIFSGYYHFIMTLPTSALCTWSKYFTIFGVGRGWVVLGKIS